MENIHIFTLFDCKNLKNLIHLSKLKNTDGEKDALLIILQNKSEKQLVNLSKKGNTEAFEELLYRHKGYIMGWILKFCKGNDHIADEVYQLATIKAWQKIGKFRGDCKFASWVNNIARNAFYDDYRRRTRREFCPFDSIVALSGLSNPEVKINLRPEFSLFEDTLPSDGVSKEEDAEQRRKTVRNILDKLKLSDREVLRMHHRDGMEYRDIAEKLNIPIGTVMSRLFYARKNALKIIKKYKYQLQ